MLAGFDKERILTRGRLAHQTLPGVLNGSGVASIPEIGYKGKPGFCVRVLLDNQKLWQATFE